MAKRWASLTVGVLAFTLLSTAAALASSSPEDIYSDYVAHGELTREYSDAELLTYLGDTSFAEYGDADVQRAIVASITYRIDRGRYPSTGFQIALIAIAVVVLVAGGVLLRYFSRPRKKEPEKPQESKDEAAPPEGHQDVESRDQEPQGGDSQHEA